MFPEFNRYYEDDELNILICPRCNSLFEPLQVGHASMKCPTCRFIVFFHIFPVVDKSNKTVLSKRLIHQITFQLDKKIEIDIVYIDHIMFVQEMSASLLSHTKSLFSQTDNLIVNPQLLTKINALYLLE